MTSVCPLFHVWVRTQSIPSSPSCVLFPCSYFPTLQSDQFFPFIFISWRLITLQYCSVFAIHWHESAMDLHVFPILNRPPTSLPIPSLWVIPVHQPRALVSCIQPGLVICFTLDNIHVLMLFSQIISPSPSPIPLCFLLSYTSQVAHSLRPSFASRFLTLAKLVH